MIKKILILVGVLVAGALWGLWYLGGKSLEEKAKQTERPELAVATGSAVARLVPIDGDADSSPDWEEGLWGTDPHNPDTDSDGTSDGEELKTGRDPREAGPDDRLTSVDDRLQAWVRQANEEKGAPLLSTTLAEINLPTAPYRLADLRIATGASTDSQRASYGHSLVTALVPLNAPAVAETSIMRLVLKIIDEPTATAELEQLARVRDSRLAAIRNLLNLTVPRDAAAIHLDFLNALVALAELDINVSRIKVEPILALESSQQYPARYSVFVWAVKEINKYFGDHQIKFSAEDNVKIPINF